MKKRKIYSADVRKQAITDKLNGITDEEIYEKYNVNYQTIRRWLRHYKKTGKYKSARKKHNYKKKDEYIPFILANRDATFIDVAAHFGIKTQWVYKKLNNMGYKIDSASRQRGGVYYKLAKNGYWREVSPH
jgi:transposase